MAQVQQRRALQAIVQELLSESCREKARARCSPFEFLPQEQRQKLEQQHPSSLPPPMTRPGGLAPGPFLVRAPAGHRGRLAVA